MTAKTARKGFAIAVEASLPGLGFLAACPVSSWHGRKQLPYDLCMRSLSLGYCPEDVFLESLYAIGQIM